MPIVDLGVVFVILPQDSARLAKIAVNDQYQRSQ